MSLNKVMLIGNLGNDPEIRYTKSGSAVATLSLATSEKWKDKITGEKKEQTEWHRVIFFGKQAEICNEYLSKGSKIYVEGAIHTNKWTDNEGKDRYSTEIKGLGMQMLDAKGANRQQSSPPPAEQPKGGDPGSFDFDDDIPFSNYELKGFA